VEEDNVRIEYRWAEEDSGRLPELVAQLVQLKVAVLVAAGGTASALAAKAGAANTPIVFSIAGDPVALGLVASLNRPGGSVTGITSLNMEVVPKRLQLLHELLPSATSMALLVDPAVPDLAEPATRLAQETARAAGLQLHVLDVKTDRDFDSVFETLANLHVTALVIAPRNRWQRWQSDRTGFLSNLRQPRDRQIGAATQYPRIAGG
jgi:putative ABC transport system substrate-binding protein